MAKFKSRYATVLKVKQIYEKQRLRELAQALHQHRQEVQKLEELKRREQETLEFIEKLLRKRLHPGLLSSAYGKMEAQNKKKVEQLSTVKSLELLVNEKRKRLIKANQEKRVMQELHKIEWQDYLKKLEQEEQKFFDEISTLKFNYNKT